MNTAANFTVRERFLAMIKDVGTHLQEREEIVKVIVLAMLSKNNATLFGKPGTAKSYLVRAISKHISGAKFFDYCFNQFSTLDEICGMPSLKAMKELDKFERNFENSACDCDIFFGDELPRGNSAIQNAILSIINEHKFSGRDVPMKLCISAQNSYLDSEEFQALNDRFLLRIIVEPIENDDNFLTFLTNVSNPFNRSYEADPIHQISLKEWEKACEEVAQVKVPHNVLNQLLGLRKAISARDIYISDRRWAQIIRVIQAECWLDNRTTATVDDLDCCRHCLWKEENERAVIFAILATIEHPAIIALRKDADAVISSVKLWKLRQISEGKRQQASKLIGDINETKSKIEKQMPDLSKKGKEKAALFLKEIDQAYIELRQSMLDCI